MTASRTRRELSSAVIVRSILARSPTSSATSSSGGDAAFRSGDIHGRIRAIIVVVRPADSSVRIRRTCSTSLSE
jgi:hypothetical protein